MKHRHYYMICAKAANMDLVKFAKQPNGTWAECADQSGANSTRFDPAWEYFLCLPQHKEACLHWLNGGDIQVVNDSSFPIDIDKCNGRNWTSSMWSMINSVEIRIKPRKEKRWIAVRNEDKRVSDIAYPSIDDARADVNSSYWSFHEIEIEI